MPNYQWSCVDCHHSYECVVSYDTRDNPGVAPCPECASINILRHFPTPMVLKASYPDGYQRPGFAALKEAAKLGVHQANQTPGTKKGDGEVKRIASEIRKLKEQAGREVIATTTGKDGIKS